LRCGQIPGGNPLPTGKAETGGRDVTRVVAIPRGRRDFGVTAACGAVILLASLINFLRFNDYPRFTPEVGLVGLALCGAAAAIGLLAAAGRAGRAAAEGLLLFLAVDINTDLWLVAVAAGTVAALLAWFRGVSLLPFLAVTAVIASVVGALGIGGSGRASDSEARPLPSAPSNAPVLLHLIMDEHIGIAGLPADNPASPAMARYLRGFYVDRGFRVYGRAYSNYFNTPNAIPDMLAAPGRNSYFAALRQGGYRLKIYQSSFLDLCSDARADACSEYPESGVRNVATAPLHTAEKAQIILSQFVSLSEGAMRTEKNYDRLSKPLRASGVPLPQVELEAIRRTSTLNAMAAMDRLIGDLRHAQPGEAYVGHILLPHYPYVMTADCRLKPVSEWQVRDAGTRREREARYFEQLRCATSKIDAALRALAASPGGKRSIVVVHGDHGSRITDVDPTIARLGQVSDRDLIAGYSTLLAVRTPGVAPGYDPAPVSVRSQLSQLAQSGFGARAIGAQPEPVPAVVLPGAETTAPRQRLPANW
jgi:hypothetical protein